MEYITFPDGATRRLPSPPRSREREVLLPTSSGMLAGTLTEPPAPTEDAALIFAGSGPTDRDGNPTSMSGRNDCLKMLAAGLARAGIASLRFDKRGVGASVATPEQALRLETFVQDGQDWLERLGDLGPFRRISIIGHSEGALIGALVASRVPVAGYVSLEGAGRTAQDTLLRQLDAQLSGPLMEAIDDVIDSLAAGQTVDPLPELMGSHPVVAAMFRATVQPYLISWFRYDPAAVLAGVAAPVLIVQGLNDLQVGIEDAERLVGANPHARRLLIDGMNHVLKRVPDDRAANIAAYSRPDLDLAPHLMPALVGFLRRDEAVDRKGVA
jgi:hypothetical protein